MGKLYEYINEQSLTLALSRLNESLQDMKTRREKGHEITVMVQDYEALARAFFVYRLATDEEVYNLAISKKRIYKPRERNKDAISN